MAMGEKGSSTTRLEAFSDGVFAIAITLLILEIKTPSRIGILASGGLSHALAGNWESYVAYVMSFALIGVFWINHHSLFEYIKRTNRGVMLANLALLMCISFLHYPTAILAENLGDPGSRAVATAFYGLSLMACWALVGRDRVTAGGTGLLLGREGAADGPETKPAHGPNHRQRTHPDELARGDGMDQMGHEEDRNEKIKRPRNRAGDGAGGGPIRPGLLQDQIAETAEGEEPHKAQGRDAGQDVEFTQEDPRQTGSDQRTEQKSKFQAHGRDDGSERGRHEGACGRDPRSVEAEWELSLRRVNRPDRSN